MQLHRFSRKGNVVFADNTTQQLQLDRGQVYREIYLHMTGAPTVTAANNVAANLARMEAWSLIKAIRIYVGNAPIRVFSGDELAMMNYFFFFGGRIPKRETTYGDGVTANPSFDRVLVIPFWMPKSVAPDDTLLDARLVSQLILEIQWGTWTDINANATAWTTQPVLEVWQRYVMPPAGDPTSLHRLFATWESSPIVSAQAAAAKNVQTLLPVGDLFRGFLMNTEVAGVDTTGILNEFRFKAGSTVYADLTEEVLREQADIYSGSVALYKPASPISASTKFNVSAWYWYDHAMSGRLAEGVDTDGFAQIWLENDYTGQANANFHVHPQLIVLPK